MLISERVPSTFASPSENHSHGNERVSDASWPKQGRFTQDFFLNYCFTYSKHSNLNYLCGNIQTKTHIMPCVH